MPDQPSEYVLPTKKEMHVMSFEVNNRVVINFVFFSKNYNLLSFFLFYSIKHQALIECENKDENDEEDEFVSTLEWKSISPVVVLNEAWIASLIPLHCNPPTPPQANTEGKFSTCLFPSGIF